MDISQLPEWASVKFTSPDLESTWKKYKHNYISFKTDFLTTISQITDELKKVESILQRSGVDFEYPETRTPFSALRWARHQDKFRLLWDSESGPKPVLECSISEKRQAFERLIEFFDGISREMQRKAWEPSLEFGTEDIPF